MALVRHEPTEAALARITGASALVLCEEKTSNHIGVSWVGSEDFQTSIMNIGIILCITIAIFH